MKILDTTIRDGSYLVNFKFSSSDVYEIVNRLDKLGFEYIEIGHGNGINASSETYGYSLQTDVEYFESARAAAKGSKLGFFCIPGIAGLPDLKKIAEVGINFVRIGCNAREIEKVTDYVMLAKKLGLEVFVNFMKTYTISVEEFASWAERLEKIGVDCVYVVDSSGGMLPIQIMDYYNAVKKRSKIKIGFHGHNNLGLAVSNTLIAIQTGYDFVDTTLQGVGRSAGNAMTEQVIMALEKQGIDTFYDIPRLLEYGFVVKKKIFDMPAINPLDLICGFADFHSSYLKYIFKCVNEKKVDPMRLIIAYSKVDKTNLDYEKLCHVAEELPFDNEQTPYYFRKYFEHENI